MFKEKMEKLQKKSNREELDLIIVDEEMLAVLKGLIALKLNKITFIETYKDENDHREKWLISFKCNELEYENFCELMKGFEIYTIEQDRFGKEFQKRLGA